MTVLAKGQLSYLILSCLVERDMYGLELIDEIKKRSGVEIKLPSLYSNINRMKELKFISSYLKESTKGPKCAYSSITENGRKELERLQNMFGSQTFILEDDKEEVSKAPLTCEENEDLESKVSDVYNDFFADIPEETESIENSETVSEDPTIVELEQVSKTDNVEEELKTETEALEQHHVDDLKEILLNIENNEETEKVEPTHNDAVFLTDEDREIENNAKEYNQRIFDVSMDYNKNKKRKSFSENQMEMVVNEAVPFEQQQERKLENVNSLKEALLQSRQGNYDEVVLNKDSALVKNVEINHQAVEESKQQPSQDDEKTQEKTEEIKDDGVFITDRVDYIPKSKRFEAPKFNFLVTENNDPLPAPKRNANLDPNCSDIKAKIETLYSLSESKNNEKERISTQKSDEKIEGIDSFGIDNINDLKDYYESQNISFKVYKRADKKAVHNTNKLTFYVDLITFGLICLGSGLFYLIFSLTGITNPNTNFMYYLFPILYFIYVGIRFYMYKRVSSKVPRPLYNFIVVFGSTILLSLIVFCLNLAAGMPINNPSPFTTSLALPIFLIVMIFIVRHYLMLFTFKKYWR